MTPKNTLLAALLCLTTLPCFAVDAVITGPTTAKVGDLVVLSTEGSVGDNFVWIMPQDIQVLTCDANNQLAFASGTPRVLTFTLIAADTDAQIDYAVHTVSIGGAQPPPVDPVPAVDFEKISRTLKPDEQLIANLIADNIDQATRQVQNMAPDQAIDLYKTVVGHGLSLRPRGSQANWIPWREAINDELAKLEPLTTNQLITIYTAIAKGLR